MWSIGEAECNAQSLYSVQSSVLLLLKFHILLGRAFPGTCQLKYSFQHGDDEGGAISGTPSQLAQSCEHTSTKSALTPVHHGQTHSSLICARPTCKSDFCPSDARR